MLINNKQYLFSLTNPSFDPSCAPPLGCFPERTSAWVGFNSLQYIKTNFVYN